MNAAFCTQVLENISFLSIHASTSFSLFIQPHGEMSTRYERERKKRGKWIILNKLQGVFSRRLFGCTLEIPSCVHVLHEWQPNIMHVRKLSQSFTDMFFVIFWNIDGPREEWSEELLLPLNWNYLLEKLYKCKMMYKYEKSCLLALRGKARECLVSLVW